MLRKKIAAAQNVFIFELSWGLGGGVLNRFWDETTATGEEQELETGNGKPSAPGTERLLKWKFETLMLMMNDIFHRGTKVIYTISTIEKITVSICKKITQATLNISNGLPLNCTQRNQLKA